MKTTIQIWGLLIAFCMMILVIPQLIGYSLIYRQCNSLASYVVEIIEVSEGVNEYALSKIEVIEEKNRKISIETSQNTINDKYDNYLVTCTKQFKIPYIEIDFSVRASKLTRRILK